MAYHVTCYENIRCVLGCTFMCDKLSELDRRAVGGAFDMVYHVTRSTHFFFRGRLL